MTALKEFVRESWTWGLTIAANTGTVFAAMMNNLGLVAQIETAIATGVGIISCLFLLRLHAVKIKREEAELKNSEVENQILELKLKHLQEEIRHDHSNKHD